MTRRITVLGVVQGVGYRPFVARLARECGVSGSVRNRGGVVEILAGADETAMVKFLDGLRRRAPSGAQVSEKHCGFVVNADHATAADVDELIRHIQAEVKQQFDVDLEPEVHRVREFM